MSERGTEQRKLAAIMFTDMVGYSALAQRNEALALELLDEHRRLVRPFFPTFQGSEVKTMGDAFLVEFASALAAVRCAVEIQKRITERNARETPERQIQLRIGIHIGDIIRRENDVFGDGVNIAARIEPMAEPGGICISEDVARQIENKIDRRLIRIGPGELKNIQLPVVIYKLLMEGGGVGAKTQRKRRNFIHSFAVPALSAVGMLLLIGVGLLLLLNRRPAEPIPDSASVAVLPFVNMSSEKENEFLCTGLAEELINTFTKVRGLKISSLKSSSAFKDSNDLQAIGKQLHVRAVLGGSVRKASGKLRITVQLVNVSDGYFLWSEIYERDVSDAFAIQSDVTKRVTDALKDQLGSSDSWGGLASIRGRMEKP
jgi:adenylate cyclase